MIEHWAEQFSADRKSLFKFWVAALAGFWLFCGAVLYGYVTLVGISPFPWGLWVLLGTVLTLGSWLAWRFLVALWFKPLVLFEEWLAHLPDSEYPEPPRMPLLWQGLEKRVREFFAACQECRERVAYLQARNQEQQEHLAALKAELESQQEELVDQLESITGMVEAVANGDLLVAMDISKGGHLETLQVSLNRMVQQLRGLINQVHVGLQSVAEASHQVYRSAQVMAEELQDQANQTNEVVVAVEQMSRTIQQATEEASQAVAEAHQAAGYAREGEALFRRTLESMETLAEIVNRSAKNVAALGHSSKSIEDVIKVIDDIADQTNLLALNAAIEAARAGEQGRGFAIVADEIRKLAERTTAATREIAQMIDRIQQDTRHVVENMELGTDQVNSGMELANQTADSFGKIVQAMQTTVNAIESIASGARGQSEASEQILQNMERIAMASGEVSSGTQELMFTAQNLEQLMEQLRRLLGQFRFEGQPHRPDPLLKPAGQLTLNGDAGGGATP